MSHDISDTFFLRNATEFANSACNEFFAWVTDFNGDFKQDAKDSYKTLFQYFATWLEHKKATIGRVFTAGSEIPTWEAFQPLIPCVYIGIIDRLLVDPTLLDYTHNDPVLHTQVTICRPLRRVSPLEMDGSNHHDNMDKLLDWVRPPIDDGTSRRYPFMHSPYADVNEDELDAYP